MPDIPRLWSHLVKIHFHTKELFLLAEELELDPDTTFVQTLTEQKHTLEHVMRARMAELGLAPELGLKSITETDDYIESNISKALGHTFRAFFDTADWFSIIIREKIIDILKPYGNECIQVVLPDYYSETRPLIDSISMGIAKIRKDKDIIVNDDVLGIVTEYRGKLISLIDILLGIQQKSTSLYEHDKRKRNEDKSKLIISIAVKLIIGIIIALFAFCAGRFHKDQNANNPNNRPPQKQIGTSNSPQQRGK